MKRLICALVLVLLFSSGAHGASSPSGPICFLRGTAYGKEALVILDDVGYLAVDPMTRAYDLQIKTEKSQVLLTSPHALFRLPLSCETGGRKDAFKIVGGKAYLPIRAVAERFGDRVHWDGRHRAIIVEQKRGAVSYRNAQLGFTLSAPEALLERVHFREDAGGIRVDWDGKYTGEIVATTSPEPSTDDGFLIDYDRGIYYHYRWNKDLNRSPVSPLEDLLMTFKRQ